MSTKGDMLAVIGAQYGSEGKGVVIHHIANRYDVHVRVGGPQAGHSFEHKGVVYKMQIVPCGWTNPAAKLILGRGMLIDFDHLQQEIEMIRAVDPTITDRLIIDAKAGVLDPRSKENTESKEREKRIGSTGEGVGAARVARVQRDPNKFQHAHQVTERYGGSDWEMEELIVHNTPQILHNHRENGIDVLLEGAQGAGLSLIHGPWPYTTNHDTNAAQLAADIGLPPRYINRTLLVARTYPIRVAGNSGPLKNETDWKTMSQHIGKDVEEQTTVTKRIRRIGQWDEELLASALILNDPTSLALMFVDYLTPRDEGITEYDKLSQNSRSFVEYLESYSNVPVRFIGTGGAGWKIVDRGGMA